jgi:hypothetical protein
MEMNTSRSTSGPRLINNIPSLNPVTLPKLCSISAVIVKSPNASMLNTDHMPATSPRKTNMTNDTIGGSSDREGTGNIHTPMKSPLTRYRVNPPPIRAVLVYTATCRPGVMKFH